MSQFLMPTQQAPVVVMQGHCLDVLRQMPSESVQCVVTSPPYWKLRGYGTDSNELGQEVTPAAFVAALMTVFREIRRVLCHDGTVWVVLGDTYQSDRKWGGSTSGKHAQALHGQTNIGRKRVTSGLPEKSLVGIPWRFAFAMQDEGWCLRNEIIWSKPDAAPERVKDRCTRGHETIFLFSRQSQYFCDMDAIAEQGNTGPRNARTIWTISTEAVKGHHAVFPTDLPSRCIKAGSRPGDTILDPFGGSGTTGIAAGLLKRQAILCELYPNNVRRIHERLAEHGIVSPTHPADIQFQQRLC